MQCKLGRSIASRNIITADLSSFVAVTRLSATGFVANFTAAVVASAITAAGHYTDFESSGDSRVSVFARQLIILN